MNYQLEPTSRCVNGGGSVSRNKPAVQRLKLQNFGVSAVNARYYGKPNPIGEENE